MPLKESKGNMYTWLSHVHCHLGGECMHKCRYCYVDNPRWGRPERYTGKIRLIEREFNVNYGSGKTIFIENCNDMFATDVPTEFIQRIIAHCNRFPDNTYVFQTKNPARFISGRDEIVFPKNSIFGTTIETNRNMSLISNAPSAQERMKAMVAMPPSERKFVTIEPVMDFDVHVLAQWIADINPEFLNLGADSKNHNLPEPSVAKVHELVDALHAMGIELREKHNLNRLKG